ncbi:MAG: hypothetical protein RBR30_08730 [Tenuifilaceae bacterium]|nr:hypothetical protein [Tenuifilaceae bacterium]
MDSNQTLIIINMVVNTEGHKRENHRNILAQWPSPFQIVQL